MDGWERSKNPVPRGSFGVEKMMGLLTSHKFGFQLMQNCDLPPPAKVFPGPDKTVLSPTNPGFVSKIGQEYEDVADIEISRKSSDAEKSELLKALRLSQTRAREAEKKLALRSKERDALLDILLQESLQLFAYKQWVKLMEFQVSKLENQQKKQSNKEAGGAENEDDQVGSTIALFVAVALCLGIAGLGYAFGYGYIP